MQKTLKQVDSAIELHLPVINREACKQVLLQSHEHITVAGYSAPPEYQLLLSNLDKSHSNISLIYQNTDLIYQLTTEKYYINQDTTPYITSGIYRTLFSKHEQALQDLSSCLIRYLAQQSYLIVGSQQMLSDSKGFWLKRLFEAIDSETLFLYGKTSQNQTIRIQESEQLIILLRQNTTFFISALQTKPSSFRYG